jgi:hypothetical protein
MHNPRLLSVLNWTADWRMAGIKGDARRTLRAARESSGGHLRDWALVPRDWHHPDAEESRYAHCVLVRTISNTVLWLAEGVTAMSRVA